MAPSRATPSPAPTPGRKPPFQIRTSASTRKASNPALSLVYASSGSSLPPASASSSSTSRCEEALSRQLDGDLGGKQMGLRSRRSSTATLGTENTNNGAVGGGPQSPRESIAEVEEGGEDQAGVVEMGTKQEERRNRLNPKASSSWLRWNAATPSFPKGKGKGKETEACRIPDGRASAARVEKGGSKQAMADAELEQVENDSATQEPPQPPPIEDGNDINEGQHGLKASQSGSETVPPPSESKSNGWFTRNPLPLQHTSKDHPDISEPSASSQTQPTNMLDAPTADPDPTTTADVSVHRDERSQVTQSAGAWKEYLTWGRKGSSRTPMPPQSEPSIDPMLYVSSQSDINESQPTSNVSVTQSNAEIEVEDPVKSVTNPSSTDGSSPQEPSQEMPRQTWGSFLYGIVIPQTGAVGSTTSNGEAGKMVAPTSATTEQPPVHIEIDPTAEIENQVIERSDSVLEQATSLTEESTLKPTSNTALRRSSQASTTGGWLNYLAFRASQKKVENRASSIATEDVMDLSNDPDFPTDPAPPAPPATNSMPPPSGLPDKKKKRLSTSSIKSATSVVPIPPSPQPQSKVSTPAPSQKASALPPPPQIPTAQPNLVIPSFATSFDRPPRSFLPPKPAIVAPTPQPGLAWRALGAVGSYVYPGQEKAEAKVDVRPTETRGLKEGREIGMDLQRRIGLAGEEADDGWKNVKRIVVVGVHGWFPAKIMNSVIGEPTGTSRKFANMMGQAVKRFFDDKGIDDIRLTLIPLEGEGTIEHRVDRLYKSYLSNPAWINDLRRADAIFFAAHSQGCIVTTHLISRLIAQGHIKTPLNAEAVARCSWAFGPVSIVPPSEPKSSRLRQANTVPVNVEEGGYQKVCMLSMCGVHQGPFHLISTTNTVILQPYLQWFESPAARELFEFQDTSSAVSQAYQRALAMVLENEVRVVLLSSLNDQVVPIYGSSFSAASHPLLLRALFVDGASYSASDFMTDLICFSLMLRNAGISDQHLIEHLSEATAGSLTGVGHSAPYEEPASFALAVDYLFHAGPLSGPSPELTVDQFSAREGRNDFELPWIMRALVDSPEIKDLFPGELRDLKEGVLHWKPTTKALKDIKKKLEPMAGRQPKIGQLKNSPSSASLASGVEPGSPAGNKSLAPPIGKHLKSRL